MKRSAFFRTVILIAVLVTVIASPIMEAYAYYGTSDVSGIIPKEKSSALELKNAEFTFNVPEFPEASYKDETAAAEYGANAVAEYVYYNPSSDTVTDTLLFPIGILPEYVGEPIYRTAVSDLTKYGVKVNGETPDVTVRYTAGYTKHYIRDGYCETLLSDCTVTHYRYKLITDCPIECIVTLYANDGNKDRRLIAYNDGKYYGILPIEDYFEIPVDPTDENSVIDVWCIGEPIDDTVKTKFYVLSDRKYDQYSQINGTLELLEEKTMSFTEFAFSTYDPQSGVSEIDHYNAVVDTVESSNYINCDFKNFADTLYKWYQFDVTVPAGETATVETSAPLYPTVDDHYYTTLVYTYNCYITDTVAVWEGMESATVNVITPYYAVNPYGETVPEKTEAGYRYTFSKIDDITLSPIPNPEIADYTYHEPEPSPKPEEPPYKVILTAVLLVPLLAAVIIAVILQLNRDEEGLGVMGVLCDIWLWFVKIVVPVLSVAIILHFAVCLYEKINWGDGNLWLLISCAALFVTVLVAKIINRFRKEAAWKRVDKIVLNIYLILPVASMISANLLADFIFFYL